MLPRALYESLPALYLIFGVLSVYLIDSAVVIASGVLLMAASLLVSYMRWTYRRGHLPKGI